MLDVETFYKFGEAVFHTIWNEESLHLRLFLSGPSQQMTFKAGHIKLGFFEKSLFSCLT